MLVSLLCHHKQKFYSIRCLMLVKFSTAHKITLTIDKRRTLTVGMLSYVCVYVCVCVCKSMTVNGRNPSTNPHLSSWITDIINRRCSSISPVFPIQRWGAGLFPSLSADLMTFTKLPYACVCERVCLKCICECLFLCQIFVLGNICANLTLSVCIPVIL